MSFMSSSEAKVLVPYISFLVILIALTIWFIIEKNNAYTITGIVAILMIIQMFWGRKLQAWATEVYMRYI